MRWLKRIGVVVATVFLLLVLASNLWIVTSTSPNVFTDIAQLPDHRVALVLGTSNKTISGSVNAYFRKRMETAAWLYKMGKVDHIIVSGDNRSMYYNEPMEMKKSLMKLGVPQSAITLDYAGLRTLDSVVRCKEIFGQSRIIIITQPIHSYRALFISDYYGMEAVAMVAKEPTVEYPFRVRLREYFARTKAILDLYILKTTPRHLGEKEQIELIQAR